MRFAVVILVAVVCGMGVSCKRQPSAMSAAVLQQQQKLSEARMKELLILMQIYANEHSNAYPNSLEDLREIYVSDDRQRKDDFNTELTNPITSQMPGYVYVKPTLVDGRVQDPYHTAILWEIANGRPDPNGAIGYADYNVIRR